MNTINACLTAWGLYWGDKWPLLLPVLGVVLLVASQKRKKEARWLLIYVLAGLIVFFCPITAFAVQKAVGEGVYWRMLWVIPLIPVCAYGFTALVKKAGQLREGKAFGRLAECLAALLAVALIVTTGENAFSETNYQLTHNYQQVPDEAAAIVELINAKRDGNQYLVATDDYLAAYLRVYDPDILMPYGRAMHGAINKNAKKIYNFLTNSPDISYGYLSKWCKKTDVKILVLKKPNKEGRKKLKEKRFKLWGKVNSYWIYKRKKTKKKTKTKTVQEEAQPVIEKETLLPSLEEVFALSRKLSLLETPGGFAQLSQAQETLDEADTWEGAVPYTLEPHETQSEYELPSMGMVFGLVKALSQIELPGGYGLEQIKEKTFDASVFQSMEEL